MNGFGQFESGPLASCDPSLSPAGACPETCSWLTTTFDFFVDNEGWQRCQIAKGQAAIQAVADNAAHYYGADSQAAQVAQQAADQQKAQVPSDVQNIADYYGAGSIQMPKNAIPTWVWIAAAAVALTLLRR